MELLYFYRAGAAPLQSLTRLPRRKAFALAKECYEAFPCVAHKRFGPPLRWYWKRRRRVERLLWRAFRAAGGRPQTRHPIYLAIKSARAIKNLGHNFDCTAYKRFSLEQFDDARISFTLGDSVALADRDLTLLTKSRLLELLAARSADQLLADMAPEYEYIEAQVWLRHMPPDMDQDNKKGTQ
ncbi:MAG: hypothetical protein LBG83_04095 [Oscillospiraceae bacterium]|jgi:hypothetical protein|nr:hypothetical protein [Oscillospiraceae bacterium]